MSVGEKSDTRVDWVWTIAIVAATLAAFLPLSANQFVNWDDPYTLTGNEQLGSLGVLSWAFTTRLMGHYQPFAWLTWAGVNSLAGMSPIAFHSLSLIGHVLNAVLLYQLTRRLTSAAGLESGKARIAAGATALVFAVHPLRVEPVAWASAFPYVLSLTWLLIATQAYLRYTAAGGKSGVWLGMSVTGYVMALLSRVTAIGYPLVLLLLDMYPLRRVQVFSETSTTPKRSRVSWMVALGEKVPFALVAGVLAIVEARSRETAPLEEIGIGARLTMSARAPLDYLGRMLVPLARSPIDPLPIAPGIDAGTLAIASIVVIALTLGVWRVRRRWPALGAAWLVYLVLLAPVMGLTPSGQTATADRYMYVPGVALSMLAGVAIAQVGPRFGGRRTSFAAIACLSLMLGGATWRATRSWHDSIALWSRALEFDSKNDIAAFNLGISLEAVNRKTEAIARYEQTLAIIPDHEPARRALVNLRAERGLAFAKERRFGAAVSDLRAAVDAKPDDLRLVSALSFSLSQINQTSEAVAVLKAALARHTDNDELAHNLARLLATTSDPTVRDGPLALRLALAVRERTNGRDPRVLDTLAAAYAAAGQPEAARRTANDAIELARQLADPALALEIAAHPWSGAR